MRDLKMLSHTLLAVAVLAGCEERPSSTAPNLAVLELSDPRFAKGGPPRCRLGFELVLDETKAVKADVAGQPYQDKVDLVLVGTDGTGMRFDTEGSQQKETANDIRRVTLDFTGTGYEAHAGTLKGIDLRFDHKNEPLNLCFDVPNVGDKDSVATSLTFTSDLGRPAQLQYGGTVPLGHNCGAQGVSRLIVTRLTHTTWDVASGGSACFYLGFGGSEFQGVVAMPIHFTLTAQGPVP